MVTNPKDPKFGQVMLKDVVLNFPVLFTPQRVMDSPTPTYSAKLTMDPDSPEVAKIKQTFGIVAKAKWKEDAENVVAMLAAQDKLALHDGATMAKYHGFKGKLFISASNVSKPTTLNRSRTILTEDDGTFYSGCRVNVLVRFWAQDNRFGKRLNGELLGVQFYEHGERVSAGGMTASGDEFEALPELNNDADEDALKGMFG